MKVFLFFLLKCNINHKIVCTVDEIRNVYFFTQVVTENERLVIFRLGRLKGVKGPGMQVFTCILCYV